MCTVLMVNYPHNLKNGLYFIFNFTQFNSQPLDIATSLHFKYYL